MGVFLLLFTLCRIVFLLFNNASFPVVYFTDFVAGLWFDLMTVCIIFLPISALELLPNKWRDKKIFRILFFILFMGSLFVSLLANMIDVEYFKFAAARSTSSLLTMLSFGNDLEQSIFSYLVDFWYLLILLLGFTYLGYFLYRKIDRIEDDSKTTPWWKQLLLYPISIALLVIIGRGGFGLRPSGPANAAKYTIDQNIPLVLNSVFTIIKSWGFVPLQEKNYFTEKELTEIFNPIHQPNGSNAKYPGNNVVVIILESFSVEYIASINGTKNCYTPFLDSLINESLVFKHCYANGKKSIDAMPSIISSIPKLMEIEYLTSHYASNKIESLPKHLKKLNYSSAFFHGATNGSMNFDVFCDLADFDHYYGRNEYNNEKDYDGTWGIFDEEFLKWSIQKMNELPAPFFSSIFTISSHHPYTIPDKHKNKFNQNEDPSLNAVMYADYALQQFFESAKTTSWYNNTLFVITADHTPASGSDIYYKDMGNMHIPLVFYHPADTNLKNESNKVAGQIDIMPTILDLVGFTENYFSFGNSLFDNKPGQSSSYIGNKYLHFADYLDKHYMLLWQDEKIIGLFDLEDKLQTNNLLNEKPILDQLERQLMAIIQTYNHALINNKTSVDKW